MSLRISWNFSTGVPPAPRHLVSYSEAFLNVPDAFWALLTSTTTPGAGQNHILSISPGNPLRFYAQNWSNPNIFIFTQTEPYWASSTQLPGHMPVSSRTAWKCNQILQGTRLFPNLCIVSFANTILSQLLGLVQWKGQAIKKILSSNCKKRTQVWVGFGC